MRVRTRLMASPAHESASGSLPPILRLFDGCAQGYIGRVEVSCLSYPDFDADPHPALAFSLTVHLQTFRVKHRDYRAYRNPPIPVSEATDVKLRWNAAGDRSAHLVPGRGRGQQLGDKVNLWRLKATRCPDPHCRFRPSVTYSVWFDPASRSTERKFEIGH
jgi:hypothetical protein